MAVIGALLAAMALPVQAQQQSFESPEEAVDAVLDALAADDLDAAIDILGREHADALIGGDPAAARAGAQRFLERAREKRSLQASGDGRRTLVVGADDWPFPIPLARGAGGRWSFDTGAGIEELVNRRIGDNELNAIEVARAYVRAQADYARRDRDGDEVREFAQQIVSTPGRHDGLYWEDAPGEERSPFGPLIADAHAYLEGRDPGDPFHGYYFRVLTRQGEHAPGGRHDYVINGNMIAGFGLVAFPADYGNSGIMTFIVNQQGRVYQKNLGEESDILGGALQVFDPDDSWVPVTD